MSTTRATPERSPHVLHTAAWAFTTAALVTGAALAGCGRNRGVDVVPPAVGELLKTTVESHVLPAEVRDHAQSERLRAWEEMRTFYRKRHYSPAWSGPKGPTSRADELIAAIAAAAPEGLAASRYDRAGLERRLAEARQDPGRDQGLDDPQAQRRLVDLDATLTYTYLTLASHLATGRLQPGTLKTDWYTKPRNVDLDGALARALASEDEDALSKSLTALVPPGEEYRRLRDAYARYSEIAARGGWPLVPAGPAFRQGASGPRVAALRQRLEAEGDLAKAAGPGVQSADFDGAVATAVAHFQRRHGIVPAGANGALGIVDATTLEALNVPVEARVRQIVVNMERWRWLPSDLGKRYLQVNVPEFKMAVVSDGREEISMRVIVGKEQSKTPVFSDQMTYIELNPSWNLPDSIVRGEVLPALAKNPGYLASRNMEVVRGRGGDAEVVDSAGVDFSQLGSSGSPYHVRQRPGADNALGRVKFMFPNQFDVYLHDTPSGHLFNAAERDFSHGCVRVEHPVELAAFLLRDDPAWSREAIEAQLATMEPKTVSLPHALPVHILYWTAWVDADGTVQFREDVYGHDAELMRGLAAEPPISLDLPVVRGEQRAGEPGAHS